MYCPVILPLSSSFMSLLLKFCDKWPPNLELIPNIKLGWAHNTSFRVFASTIIALYTRPINIHIFISKIQNCLLMNFQEHFYRSMWLSEHFLPQFADCLELATETNYLSFLGLNYRFCNVRRSQSAIRLIMMVRQFIWPRRHTATPVASFLFVGWRWKNHFFKFFF